MILLGTDNRVPAPEVGSSAGTLIEWTRADESTLSQRGSGQTPKPSDPRSTRAYLVAVAECSLSAFGQIPLFCPNLAMVEFQNHRVIFSFSTVGSCLGSLLLPQTSLTSVPQ